MTAVCEKLLLAYFSNVCWVEQGLLHWQHVRLDLYSKADVVIDYLPSYHLDLNLCFKRRKMMILNSK